MLNVEIFILCSITTHLRKLSNAFRLEKIPIKERPLKSIVLLLSTKMLVLVGKFLRVAVCVEDTRVWFAIGMSGSGVYHMTHHSRIQNIG